MKKNRIRARIVLLSWIGMIGLMNIPNAFAQKPAEALIVFVQNGTSEVSKDFETKKLPEIKALAKEWGLDFSIVNAGKGAPENITLTPSIVYQNHLGRSIYQGRTNTIGRIRNFIRTSRFVPQGKAPHQRDQIFIAQKGRMRLWAPIKVAEVTGTRPKNYDHTAFKKEALQSLKKGFKQFNLKDNISLKRGDRGFYMDFYPWRSDDGTLYLSLALYSQFHCKDPVFEMKKPPLIGPYKKRKALFKKAAQILEQAVMKQLADPDGGDGFDPIHQKLPVLSFETLGFKIPPAPQKKQITVTNKSLPSQWTLDQPGKFDPPLIQFRFPAPLDQYQGEVKTASGDLTHEKGGYLKGSKGHIEVSTQKAITMGEPVLDEAIKGGMLLGANTHPKARFDVSAINGDGRPLVFGELTPVNITGNFTLKGKTIPMSLIGEVEPIINESGEPRLLIRCGFKIDLREFKIEGAEGPEPQRHMLLFDVNLVWKPEKM